MKDFAPPPPSGDKRPRRRSDEAPAPVSLDPPEPTLPDPAGPRPLSERQRGHRRRATGVPPPPTLTPLTVRLVADVVRPRREPGKRQARANRLLARRRNRIRPNYARAALRLSLLLFVAVSLAALFFSPRLWVRTVRIEGLQTISAERIAARLDLRPRTNLVLLPAARLKKAVEAEPAVARAHVRRVPPNSVLVSVEERRPVAVVQTENVFYTIDRALVPFRKSESAEPGLPLIVLGPAADTVQDEQTPLVPLGKRMIAPGLPEASKCLTWALGRASKFPLARIVVDPFGGLCLNRRGGAEVRLGTGADLDKKLSVLDLLLTKREDVLRGDVSYVNLFAYDAPAILTREAAASAIVAPRPGP